MYRMKDKKRIARCRFYRTEPAHIVNYDQLVLLVLQLQIFYAWFWVSHLGYFKSRDTSCYPYILGSLFYIWTPSLWPKREAPSSSTSFEILFWFLVSGSRLLIGMLYLPSTDVFFYFVFFKLKVALVSVCLRLYFLSSRFLVSTNNSSWADWLFPVLVRKSSKFLARPLGQTFQADAEQIRMPLPPSC